MDSKNIPKVELHCHLEACFQRQTVNEIGQTLGLDVPEDPEVFKREWLITEPVDNLEQALKKFANIQKLWGSEEELDLTLEDFNRINDHAAACSFLPPEEKQKVWPRETSQRENVRGTHRLDVK